MELISRVAATQATVDRFLDVDFSWGANDCVHLAAHQLVQLGYPDPLADVAPYATYRNARKAMKKAGVESLSDYLDKRFEKIAPAAAVDGDLLALPADEADWEALALCVGHERVLAFVPIGDVVRCTWGRALGACTHAWRVPPASREVI